MRHLVPESTSAVAPQVWHKCLNRIGLNRMRRRRLPRAGTFVVFYPQASRPRVLSGFLEPFQKPRIQAQLSAKQMPRLVFHGFSLRTRSLLGRSRYKNVSPRGMCVRRCMQTLICVLAMCFEKRLDYFPVGSGGLQCKGREVGRAGSAASQGCGFASPLCLNVRHLNCISQYVLWQVALTKADGLAIVSSASIAD